jgi:hypothetical protein
MKDGTADAPCQDHDEMGRRAIPVDMQQWIGRVWREWRGIGHADPGVLAENLRPDRRDSEIAPDGASGATPDEQAGDPHLGYLG